MLLSKSRVPGSSPGGPALNKFISQEIQTGKYRHYKGKEYEVIGLSHHSETLEPLVVYKALYESEKFGKNALWVRPLEMFLEKVIINEKEISRFEYLG